jgi:hypothetical protein
MRSHITEESGKPSRLPPVAPSIISSWAREYSVSANQRVSRKLTAG